MRLIFGLLFLAPLYASPAYAGAWTQAAGQGQIILTGSYYDTDHYFDNAGHKQKQSTYSQYAASPYVEYGLWDGLTVGTNLTFQHVHQASAPFAPGQTNTGLGDSEFFVRQRLWQGSGLVVSAQPMIKLPALESSTAAPRLGGDSMDAGLGLSGGYGFSAYGRNHFVDLDTQYRYRFGSPGNQVNLAGTLGIGLLQNLMLMPQAFLTYRTSAPANALFTQSSGDDYNLIKLELSLVYQWREDISLQAGAFSAITGRNTGTGTGGLFALWKSF
jgi:hypothetical protein